MFVGEGWPCRTTADEQFFELPQHDWVLEDADSKVGIPQWPGRKDFFGCIAEEAQLHLLKNSKLTLNIRTFEASVMMGLIQ